MKTSVELDDELAAEVVRTGSLIHEEPDTVVRLAIQAGLPLVASRSEAQRPEGYFAGDYPLPEEWLQLEAAVGTTAAELRQQIRLMAALKLFELGKLSSGKAAELAGMSRVEFLETCGRYQVSVFNYPDDGVAAELQREVQAIANQHAAAGSLADG